MMLSNKIWVQKWLGFPLCFKAVRMKYPQL